MSSAIRITVRLFAILRDRGGTPELTLDLAAGARIGDAKRALAERLPAIGDFLHRVAFAVNREYVPATTELRDGDELAIIPPVSGG